MHSDAENDRVLVRFKQGFAMFLSNMQELFVNACSGRGISIRALGPFTRAIRTGGEEHVSHLVGIDRSPVIPFVEELYEQPGRVPVLLARIGRLLVSSQDDWRHLLARRTDNARWIVGE